MICQTCGNWEEEYEIYCGECGSPMGDEGSDFDEDYEYDHDSLADLSDYH